VLKNLVEFFVLGCDEGNENRARKRKKERKRRKISRKVFIERE
jgi:uncharacterized protein YheU (UPF0270 family)